MAKQLEFKVNSKETYDKACKLLWSWFEEHKYLRASIMPGKDRSKEQNATWSAMYKAIWLQSDFESFDYARAYCKWHLGIPILKRDSNGFLESFTRVFGDMPYEHCIALMRPNKLFPSDGFPVTRHLGVKQGNEYIKGIADWFNGLEKEGFRAPYVDFSEILKEG